MDARDTEHGRRSLTSWHLQNYGTKKVLSSISLTSLVTIVISGTEYRFRWSETLATELIFSELEVSMNSLTEQGSLGVREAGGGGSRGGVLVLIALSEGLIQAPRTVEAIS